MSVHLTVVNYHCKKDQIKYTQDKTQEVKVVKEQLDSVKRKSAEEEPEFKYKSNRKQFKFNNEVKENFNQTLAKGGVGPVMR